MQVFPAIDLLEGRAVRLEQGRPESAKVYSHAPWELAGGFVAAGAPRLHVVDLDAALSGGERHNRPTIARILAAAGKTEVEVGGGIRSLEDCARVLGLGAQYVVMGTAAIKTPTVVEEACALYPRRVVVAVDAREGKVAVEGWQEATGVDAVEVGRQMATAGAVAVLYTDIGRDGMRTGPNLEATRRLATTIHPCAVIASGGMASLDDLLEVRETGAASVVIGKALYEGVFTLKEALAVARSPAGE
jgi:phosphoribosylformimino-5-aminoimidazole carboxamide ribotide isomerase